MSTDFNPADVTIERHRPSVTQGEVSVSYRGELLGQFGDRIELCTDTDQHDGHHHDGAPVITGFHGHGDAYWIGVARRTIAKRTPTEPAPGPATYPLYMSHVREGDRISGFPGVDGQVTVTAAWWHSDTLTHRFRLAETGDQVHTIDRNGAPDVVLHERPGFGPFDATYQVGDRVQYRFTDRTRGGVVTEVTHYPDMGDDPTKVVYTIFGGAGIAQGWCGTADLARVDTPKPAVGQVWKRTNTGDTVTVVELEDEWGVIVRTREAKSVNLMWPGWELVTDAPEPAAPTEEPATEPGVFVSRWTADLLG